LVVETFPCDDDVDPVRFFFFVPLEDPEEDFFLAEEPADFLWLLLAVPLFPVPLFPEELFFLLCDDEELPACCLRIVSFFCSSVSDALIAAGAMQKQHSSSGRSALRITGRGYQRTAVDQAAGSRRGRAFASAFFP
jgi:hypothetical protein